jgi:hypothetical protein
MRASIFAELEEEDERERSATLRIRWREDFKSGSYWRGGKEGGRGVIVRSRRPFCVLTSLSREAADDSVAVKRSKRRLSDESLKSSLRIHKVSSSEIIRGGGIDDCEVMAATREDWC